MSASNVETPEEAGDAIVKRWFANWSGTSKTFLVGEKQRPTQGVAHATLRVAHRSGDLASMGAVGNRKFLRVGTVLIEIKVPDGGGTSQASTLAHDARAIFEGRSFSGLRFFGGDVFEVGTDGEWLVYLASVPFDYHETK